MCQYIHISNIHTHTLTEKHATLMIARAMLAFFRDGLQEEESEMGQC